MAQMTVVSGTCMHDGDATQYVESDQGEIHLMTSTVILLHQWPANLGRLLQQTAPGRTTQQVLAGCHFVSHIQTRTERIATRYCCLLLTMYLLYNAQAVPVSCCNSDGHIHIMQFSQRQML